MRRYESLNKSEDFAAIRRSGRRWSDKLLLLQAQPNCLKVSRYGFSVGRKVGNAVVRNKIKRRLREAAALSAVTGGWDLLIVARYEAAYANFNQLSNSMRNLLRRAGVTAHSTEGTFGSTESK